MPAIRSSTFRSFLWSASDVLLRQGTQLVVSVVLSRLLTPAEFGTVALLYFFNGISLVFIEGGLSSALIQRVTTSRLEESSVFWLNLAIGLACGVTLAAFAAPIARWFASPVLMPLTCLSALTIVIGSTATIQTTLLGRQLDFKTQMKAGAIANSVAGIAAILLALNGAGVWALGLQALIAASLNAAGLWWLSPWRPVARFDARSIASLWRYGAFMLGAGLLENAYSRVYSLLIGRWSGVVALGFYNRADNVMQFPMASLTATFSRVAFPILSAAQADPPRMRSGLRTTLQTVAAINAPLMFGLAAVAAPAVALLLGAQWDESVPVLRILCVAGAFWPLQVMNYQAIVALGRSRLMFQVETAKRLGGLLALVLAARHGFLAIASIGVVYNLVGFAINAHCAGRLIGYGLLRQMRDLGPTYGVAGIVAIGVAALAPAIHYPPLIAVPILTGMGAVTYLILGVVFRLESITVALGTIAPGRTPKTPNNDDDARRASR